MALGDATVFAIPPDGGTDPTITRSYKSDVLRARNGTEKRAALRGAPVRTLAYTALFLNQDEAADFRLAWLAATERLRFLVPLWPEYAVPTAFPTTSTIAGDFTNRDFSFSQVLVYQDRTHWEPATIETNGGSLLTLTAPLVGTYTPLAARVLPLMPAWLSLPTMTLLETQAESVAVSFVEEVEGAAAIDPDAGLAAAATCVSVTLEQIYFNGTGAPGPNFFGYTVHAYDAAGMEIPNPTATWTCTATGDVSLDDAEFSVTDDGRVASLQFSGDADASFHLTATVGSVTATVDVSA
jgi:hypothetical protein